MDRNLAAEMWDRYQRGESKAFSKRLYTPAGQKAFDEVARKYRADRGFKQTADRYIAEFERLLDEVARDERGPQALRAHLTSETGLVYTLLADRGTARVRRTTNSKSRTEAARLPFSSVCGRLSAKSPTDPSRFRRRGGNQIAVCTFVQAFRERFGPSRVNKSRQPRIGGSIGPRRYSLWSWSSRMTRTSSLCWRTR